VLSKEEEEKRRIRRRRRRMMRIRRKRRRNSIDVFNKTNTAKLLREFGMNVAVGG
jgi:hypothetical protein